jgi:hypothetical protein
MEHSKAIIIGVVITLVLLFILYSHSQQSTTTTYTANVVVNKRRPRPHVNPDVDAHVVGGCAGTRYGCCPGGVEPKRDAVGSNCRR